ncbi:MAG: hypothetical protein ACR2OM_08100 [Aestuariivirgaceae bacterium]
MAMDLLFCTDELLDAEAYRVAIMKWARQFDNLSVNDIDNGRIQLWYENEATDVGFSISEVIGDWTEHLDEKKLNEIRDQIGDKKLCDWQFTLNYFRPNFFAREAMPYLAAFAELNNFSILDPESAEIIPNDAEDLAELWTIQNRRAMASILFEDDGADMTTYAHSLDDEDEPNEDEDQTPSDRPYMMTSNGLELTFVDKPVLDRCWKYNYIKDRMQADTDVFIPKIMLLQLTQDEPFADMFIWTRTVVTAVPDTQYVLMAWTKEVSDDPGFKYGIVRGSDLSKTIMKLKPSWSKHNGYLLPPPSSNPEQASTDLFDRCWDKLAKPHDPMKCAMLGGFMCVVETELVDELSSVVTKH